MYIQLLLPFDIVIHFRFHLNGSHAQRLPVTFIHESVMFTSDVLSPVHSVSWSAHSVSRPMPLSRGSTVAAGSRWPAPRCATGAHSVYKILSPDWGTRGGRARHTRRVWVAPSLCAASRWAQFCVPNSTLTAQLITWKTHDVQLFFRLDMLDYYSLFWFRLCMICTLRLLLFDFVFAWTLGQ